MSPVVPATAFIVYGIPAPQGSKTPIGRSKTGRVILVESSKKVAPWRAAVAEKSARHSAMLQRRYGRPFEGALRFGAVFFLPRPKRAMGDAHIKPTTYPDLDKLVRSTLDGMAQGGLIANDSHVTIISAEKHYVSVPGLCECFACIDGMSEVGAILSISEVKG